MGEVAQRWNMDESQINKRRLEKHYYFIPHNWERNLFSSKIKELNIRYVLVYKSLLNITVPGYSSREETNRLMKCLDENRAVLIYASNTALIYEFP
jgi:hypothetical protein